jgi:hypothetical protein
MESESIESDAVMCIACTSEVKTREAIRVCPEFPDFAASASSVITLFLLFEKHVRAVCPRHKKMLDSLAEPGSPFVAKDGTELPLW